MMIRFRIFLFSSASFIGLAASQATALPTSVDPSKVQQNLGTLERSPKLRPKGIVTTPAPRAKSLSDAAKAEHFTVRDVVVQGATVYSQEQLRPLYADMVGKKITLADAHAIAEKITAHYRSDGYTLSQAVLLQEGLATGRLNFKIVEGYISKVILKGDESYKSALIQLYADKITAEKPANIHTIERYLLLMNDLPGVTVQSAITPSADAFGAAEMTITVSHKRVDGALSLDNRGTRYIGPVQYRATAGMNSLLGLDERTVIRAVTESPSREMRFADIVHEEQLGSDGTRLILSSSKAKTNPRFTLTTLDVEGDTFFLQTKLQHPFIRSREENLFGHVSFDYRNTQTDVGGVEFSNDRLRTLRLGGNYDFVDSLNGSNQFAAELSRGINILHASENDVLRSRADGQSDFTKLAIDIAHTQPLIEKLSLFTAMSSQYSFDPLLPAEQFALGGADFGSAYDPAELSGDHGVAFRAEIRYAEALGLRYLSDYQLYGFYDIGEVWNRDAVDNKNSLASTGVGIRNNLTPWLSSTAELAVPLTKQISTEGDKDPRLFLSLTGRF